MRTMHENTLSNEELEILQEIMNIAFGRATSDLAEVIDIYIRLSVPYINILKATELPVYLKKEINDYNNISLVEQRFWGNFRGLALLIFPSGAEKELITLLNNDKSDFPESDTIDELEKETLLEVGNILIGACIGKMADLLKDVIRFSPPRVLIENLSHDTIPEGIFDSNNTMIILRTLFHFEKKDISGFLFLLVCPESITLLKKALNEFMEQYE
ncbi:MAG: chemotaxis protein CheC [Candidatus Brocadia sp.]